MLTSKCYTYTSLLQTRFDHQKLMEVMRAQILHIKAQFLEHLIKTLLVDNAVKFISPTFDDLCTSLGIDVQ